MSHPHLSLLHSIAATENVRYLAADVRRVEGMRELQIVLVSPNIVDLVNIVDNNGIGPSLFTRRDIQIVEQIHGVDVAAKKTSNRARCPTVRILLSFNSIS